MTNTFKASIYPSKGMHMNRKTWGEITIQPLDFPKARLKKLQTPRIGQRERLFALLQRMDLWKEMLSIPTNTPMTRDNTSSTRIEGNTKLWFLWPFRRKSILKNIGRIIIIEYLMKMTLQWPLFIEFI